MCRLVLFALLMLTTHVTVAGQTRHVSIQEARDLYYAAAYEQALSALDRVNVRSPDEAATVEQYRAACLLALGSPREAEQALERLVTIAPDMQPDQLAVAPWIALRFAAVRARVLSRAQQRQMDKQEPSVPAGMPDSPVAIPDQPTFYTIDDPAVIRPVPLRERVPEPPATKGIDFSGTVTLQVDISTDGSVERVNLEGTIHPIYDSMIREAANTWRYRPATLDDRPVKFRKALKIEIK